MDRNPPYLDIVSGYYNVSVINNDTIVLDNSLDIDHYKTKLFSLLNIANTPMCAIATSSSYTGIRKENVGKRHFQPWQSQEAYHPI